VPETTLTTASSTRSGTFTVTENQLVQIVLETGSSNSNIGVLMSIYDSTGRLVTILSSFGNDTTTVTVWLRQDAYRVVFEGIIRDGSKFTDVIFTLQVKNLSDSIDPYEADPNESGSGTGGTPPPDQSKKPTYTSWYWVESPPPSGAKAY
jgi:hypothetical protein